MTDHSEVRRDALRQSLVAALNGHSVSPKTCGAILTRWDEAEARLASVPALVEALRELERDEGYTFAALTVYEQSQGNG